MEYLNAFLIGGAICLIAQLLLSLTSLSSARILVLFVVMGAVLEGLGLYGYLVDIGGCGATVPLTGFGYSLAKGAMDGARESGIIGALGGGIKATAPGVAASIIFGLIVSLIFKPRTLK